ncbi:MAG: hypothetical protein COV55_01345 [Candidatus Komeilibacteria bacterium CG11_big_fil_rev_8_21_14_0_20_36_20]|uniref:Uncharacterized protein n=1 Tax=Candidatus Komeilibacteria bacterium CG11_big_fil_rev_8_21_14_0_20_36_20 TaxID=1974477 RepID=A0A2H0NFX2_9BACT|nr:MAG: hypothetical protein COV55_01345 [Candidatus Komeilibacteria bacterium CG11_big_fil_rev_8_21_14_0_20_36_20]PJC55151.1 MAG: hypothetical protein CO027_03270 [Candidatus Komeilibacteria bacterium CG_4_9_14_0_2_um_filter_36_13]
MDKYRRRFFISLSAFAALILTKCTGQDNIVGAEEDNLKLTRNSLSLTPNTVAFFIAEYNPVYVRNWSEYPGDWLMMDFNSNGIGDYKFYVNGALVLDSINTALFDPRKQSLIITKNNQIVFDYRPPKTHLHS